ASSSEPRRSFIASARPAHKAAHINATTKTRRHENELVFFVSSSLRGCVFVGFVRPFDFQLRTRIVFGEGSLERLGDLARELGFTRTLIVSDPGIVATGQ